MKIPGIEQCLPECGFFVCYGSLGLGNLRIACRMWYVREYCRPGLTAVGR